MNAPLLPVSNTKVQAGRDISISPQHKKMILLQIQIHHHLRSLFETDGEMTGMTNSIFHMTYESHRPAHTVHTILHHTATRLIHNFNNCI